MAKNVFIVGGGLAGMTVAKELKQRARERLSVTILEATERLGGKAGADHINGNAIEHGYHVFPLWYANTRALLAELGLLEHLSEIHQIHYLSKDSPQIITVKDVPSSWQGLRNVLHDLFHGLLSWREMLLLMYLILDLANQPWRYKSTLDQTTANAFLGSRLFATEKIANLEHLIALQGVSCSSFELSAMTLQKVARAWFRYRSPIFSIFPGNLQDEFIRPFENLLEREAVNVRKRRCVKSLSTLADRLERLELHDGTSIGQPEDIFVLATPPEVTARFATEGICRIEESVTSKQSRISDLSKLRTAPMAAIYLTLREAPTLKNGRALPPEHIVLRESRYLTSFISISRFWPNLRRPTLSIIASDIAPVIEICGDIDQPIQDIRVPAAQLIIEELGEYIVGLHHDNIDQTESYARLNLKEPLFLNTVGSWHYRPETNTKLANLYITGDYCQTEADLTTMESAIISGRQTANAILRATGFPTSAVLSLKTRSSVAPRKGYPRQLLRICEWFAFPFALMMYYSLLPSDRSRGRFVHELREFFR